MAKAKYVRGSDGFFQARVWDGTYNPDGSKHRKTIRSSKSSADLERKVNALRQAVSEGKSVQKTGSYFVDYCRIWLKTYKGIREDNTIAMYSNVIEKHIAPTLDGVKLQDIRRTHFQLVINAAADRPRTCQQIALTFRQVIKSAMRDKYLPGTAYEDICEDIDVPKYVSKEKRALYPEEIAAIKTADFTPMQRCFIYIIYGCGLRRGEVLGLNKDLHVDLKHGILKVNTSIRFLKNDPGHKDPKSHNGFRQVPMPDFLVDFLKEYIPTLDGVSDYLIHKQDGSMMTKSAYDNMWASIVEKMNAAAGGTDNLKVIYGFTAHTFRHNYCTSLCYQVPAISIKKIAQLMGDSEMVVLKVYNHVKEERENVEKVINNAVAM